MMGEAKCNCTHCVTGSRQEEVKLCEPIYHNIPMLITVNQVAVDRFCAYAIKYLPRSIYHNVPMLIAINHMTTVDSAPIKK